MLQWKPVNQVTVRPQKLSHINRVTVLKGFFDYENDLLSFCLDQNERLELPYDRVPLYPQRTGWFSAALIGAFRSFVFQCVVSSTRELHVPEAF